LEIILVDNYSFDNTIRNAKTYDIKVLFKGPERSAQVNFGATKARGKYIYRVDSDFVLQPSVVQEAVEACEKRGFDAIAIHNTSDPTVSFWAQVRKLERDCYRRDELNAAARFWKKELFMSIGGFDETLVAGEDYDLHNRAVKGGYRIGWISAEEIHIGEPRTLSEIARKHYYYGRHIGKFVAKDTRRSLRQLSPLRASLIRDIPVLLRNPLVMFGFLIYQLVRYLAAFVGIVAVQLGSP
jgi:glycosyltransferase involved in cell wall biosynthesis